MNLMITAKDLHRDYPMGQQRVRALDGVDLEVKDGEFVALLGRSGSGKSTLLNMIGGLDRPTSGHLDVAGNQLATLSSRDLSVYRRRTVGFIFQSFNLVPRLRAWENVGLPMVFAGLSRRARRVKAMEMLERVGLAARAEHRANELSGGEQQRVAVARALVNEPAMLLCDEPTGNLDTQTSNGIMELIAQTHRQGNTVIMVTHDPVVAARHATRTLRMSDGRIVEEAA